MYKRQASHHVAHWDKYARPETKPRFDRGVLDTWWYDGAKAAKLTATTAASEDLPDEPTSHRVYLLIALLAGLALAGIVILISRRPARKQ